MSKFAKAVLVALATLSIVVAVRAQTIIPVGRVGQYRVATGSITLDGSNPSSAATGLTTVLSCTASLKATATPGDDPSWNSLNINGTSLDLYAYKNTGGTDPTLVASTNNTAVFYWVCIGT